MADALAVDDQDEIPTAERSLSLWQARRDPSREFSDHGTTLMKGVTAPRARLASLPLMPPIPVAAKLPAFNATVVDHVIEDLLDDPPTARTEHRPSGISGITSRRAPSTRMLGRYELLTKVSAGGMATVYVARTHGMNGFSRCVAVKVCHPHLADDAEFSNMFFEEARLAANIGHPNVVATLDVGFEDVPFLVMDYIEGASLAELVRVTRRARQHVPLAIAARIVLDMLAGLHAAHEACDHEGRPLHIVHRDVSPQNILIGVDGVTRLADFGIAKAALGASHTRAGHVRGKFAYMAPEQFRDEHLTRSVDVFAAGVVLWELLAGRRLFAGTNDYETTARVLRGSIANLTSLRPALPASIDDAVQQALDRNVSSRFVDARCFADAIERAVPRVASVRDTAKYLAHWLGPKIEERRSALQAGAYSFPSMGHDADEISDFETVVPVHDDSESPVELDMGPAIGPPPVPRANEITETTRRSRVRPMHLVLATLGVLLFAVPWLLMLRMQQSATPVAAAAVSSLPVVAERAPVHEIVPEPVRAPEPVILQPVVPSAPPAVVAATVAPTRAVVRRAPRRAAPRRSAAATHTRASAPATGGEYIPDGA